MIRRSWAQTASIEETLALWAASLREIKKRIRPLFGQERVAKNAGLFLEGLLGDEQRKTGSMRAEAAGDPGSWRQQAMLGRRDWDADARRDIIWRMTVLRRCRLQTGVPNVSMKRDQLPGTVETRMVAAIARRDAPDT